MELFAKRNDYDLLMSNRLVPEFGSAGV